jgi:tetratricopeptide (TPR) repeat protein
MSSDLQERIAELHEHREQSLRDQNWDKAYEQSDRLLALLKDADDLIGAARTQINMGQIAEELGRLAQARQLYLDTDQLALQLENRELRAAALHRLGHLERPTDPQQARHLFRQCLDLGSEDAEANALSLAMIGQIDFTEGDHFGGLEMMLTALNQMPPLAMTLTHLLEHIVYFSHKLSDVDFVRLVKLRIQSPDLQDRLLKLKSS